MPKTKFQNVVFTIIMATIMVYGMIVYNVALNTGGVTNATFGMALHEMPIMVPIAFILEFFVVEKLATKLAFRLQHAHGSDLAAAVLRPAGQVDFPHPFPEAAGCRDWLQRLAEDSCL